jgi:hypothetical protein
VIALPFGADTWPEERLRAALLHELAHIQRRDWPLQRLAHLACALYWFHPFVWIAARAARAESEKASDDLVLAAGLPAAAYADHLLTVARALHRSSGNGVSGVGRGAVAMVSPRMSGIEARLRAVLARDRSRCPISSRRCTATVITGLLLAVPVAALRPVAQAPGTTGDPFDGPGVLVRKIEGLTQYISKDYLRAVYPAKDGNDARVVEFDRAAREKAPARVVPGYKTTLPNGFNIEVVGMVRLALRNGYWQYADPGAWRKPDGTPLAKPLLPQPLIQSGQRPSMTGGIAPVLVITRFTPPLNGRRAGFSTFKQPLGVAQDQEFSWIIPHGDTFGPEDSEVSSYSYPLFPRNARTFALRTGVAAGPWTTKTVKRIAFTSKTLGKMGSDPKHPIGMLIKLDDRPAIEYIDPNGRWHHEYFLDNGKRLGAEDRRIVAVDKNGKTFPLESRSLGGGLRQFGVPLLALAFTPAPAPASPFSSHVRLGDIRELRLETRPFQRVEFRNLQIPPQKVGVANRK